MRSLVATSAATVVLGALAAAAQTSALPPNDGVRLRLPHYELYPVGQPAPLRDDWSAPAQGSRRLAPLSQPQLSIGTLNIHLGNEGPGLHMTHYDFGETRFLGGEVTGTLDAGRGTIRLRWPTGP